MTLSDLETLVLSWLDDPNAGYFTAPQVLVWLNNAQREVQKQLINAGENWYVQKASSSTAADAETYDLPSDFLKLHKLEVLVSGTAPDESRQTILPRTLMQLEDITGTGVPEIYCIKKNCLILRPIPDATYTIYMHYSTLVADMVNLGDYPDVPTQYQEYLAVLATIDGMLKDQRDTSAMKTKKADYLALMKQDAKSRNVDVPRMIREVDDCGGGYLF